ncbi:uncharacterized protein PV09_07201 [Verruconis gallopava]|uniref:Uncharacterized protein n=1 Tax=Verruconis gallopava TaxID=253628 RepID=A0A0D2A3N6_9PEZI|nr:uncharacterized protein PV09_07201 [Verruconis gallopava]KIW01443.1 hypothetical protein PV09_07201 [Verruconis gallopava]
MFNKRGRHVSTSLDQDKPYDADELSDLVLHSEETNTPGRKMTPHQLMEVHSNMSQIEVLDLTAGEETSFTSSQETDEEHQPATIPCNSPQRTSQCEPQVNSEFNEAAENSCMATNISDVGIMQPTPKKISSSTNLQPRCLAERLRCPDCIIIPQVLGKEALSNPSIIDQFIATPALRAMLELESHPEEVLWASFLKNNIFALDSTAACDNMQVWLDANPSRYKHVTSLVFHDFLSHPKVLQTRAYPHVWSVYRPIRLMAKCPNLSRVELHTDIRSLPGFREDSYLCKLDTYKLADSLNRRHRIGDLLGKTSKTFKEITMTIGIEPDTSKAIEEASLEPWRRDLESCVARAALAAGRTKAELTQVKFSCLFYIYGQDGYF